LLGSEAGAGQQLLVEALDVLEQPVDREVPEDVLSGVGSHLPLRTPLRCDAWRGREAVRSYACRIG
jgi:hypothetical protein